MGKRYRTLKEVSIWALMVCVRSSWVLACASQWMCETGTVLVGQGVPNRSKWDFGKKSTGEGGKRCSYSPSERRLGLSGLLLFTLQSPSPPHKQRLSTSLRSWEQWGSPEYLLSFEPHSSTGHLYCPRQLPPLQRGNPRQE